MDRWREKAMERKIRRLGISGMLILSLGIILNVTENKVSAQEQSVTGEAFITVKAPDTNSLYLSSVPSFDFGGQKIAYKEFELTDTASATYTAINITGKSAIYQIQAQVSEFTGKNINGESVKLPVKAFYITVEDNQEKTLFGTFETNVYGQKGTIATSTKEAYGAQSTGEVSARLVIDGKNPLVASDYTATITNSLVLGV